MRISVAMAVTCLILVGLSAADESQASIQKHTDIPPESLGAALETLAKDRNFQIVYVAEEVSALRTLGAVGEFTSDEALKALLKGTGLSFRYLDEKTVTIVPIGSISTDTAGAGPASPSAQPPPTGEGSKVLSDTFLVAQADQGTSGDAASVKKQEDQEPKQKKPDELEEVVVTGTHIRGDINQTNSIIVIDNAQIERSGYSSTQDLFRSLPQNFSSGEANEDGFLTSNNGAFQNSDFSSGVNLRGLGASSTLVLLNGHRLAPSGFGTLVDVSTIPLAAIDHVEILTDGSSAIYGSDAVGGVVNVILKSDYRGSDTNVRYGATSDGGRDEVLVAQTLGSNWVGGNIVGTAQFQKQTALPSTDRDFSTALPSPSDLLPQTRSYSGTLDGRQALSDQLELYGDVLLSTREFTHASSFNEFGLYSDQTRGDSRSIDITPGLRYTISSRWSIELDGLYGYQRATDTHASENPYPLVVFSSDNNRFTEKALELIANGHLGATPAGDVGVAVGTSYRSEILNTAENDNGTFYPVLENRHVTAGFAELHAPLVGEANRLPMVAALELSAALRRDQYSDFGSTTNPHLGLRWAPWADFAFRASYGKSFRAPGALEEYEERPAEQQIYIYQVANPTGPGVVPALILGGSKTLTAERARTLNFGLEYKPQDIQGFKITLDYYDILFQDRIIFPPIPFNFLQQPSIYGSLITPVASDAAAQAIVDADVAAGATFSDFYGNGVTGVRYLYDDRQQNAAVVRQSGLDLTSQFAKAFGAYTLTSQVNVSYIDKIDTQFSPTASFANQVNTVGSPVRWRARFNSTWAGAAWALTGAVNAVGSYLNTGSAGNPPISSWTTIDLNATLNVDAYLKSRGWQGVSVSLVMLNALNRDPPYVANATATYPVNYDPTNANPLGRFIALAVRKKL